MRDPGKTGSIDPAAVRTSPSAGRLGLALSGGGLRASLFHVGVLARLAELDLLRQVEVLSCVSGGSIVGALYYLYLKRELEARDDDLRGADYVALVEHLAQHLQGVVQKNLRWRTFSSLGATLKMARADYSRTDRLGEVLDERLYRPVWTGEDSRPIEMRELCIRPGGRTDFHPRRDNPGRHNKVPVLVLNATTLNSGHAWWFEAVRMGEAAPSPLQRQLDKNLYLEAAAYEDMIELQKTMPLGMAVAASAAVPAIFPPFPISRLYPDPTSAGADDQRLRVQLVDGGVHDNLGTAALRRHDCTRFVISDATGQMADQIEPDTWAGAVVGRSSSILMDRAREAELERLHERHAGRIALMHMQRELVPVQLRALANGRAPGGEDGTARVATSYGVDREVQRLLAGVRTDLDAFSDVEALALMADGYLMSATEFDRLRADGPAWGNLRPTPIGLDWRFSALFEPLRDGRAALTERLRVAHHRLFKLPKLVPRVKAECGLALLGLAVIVVTLAVWVALTAEPLQLAIGLASAFALVLAYPAYLALRFLSRATDVLAWLRYPLGWIAAGGTILAAPFLFGLAGCQIWLTGRYLAAGQLARIGIMGQPPSGREPPGRLDLAA